MTKHIRTALCILLFIVFLAGPAAALESPAGNWPDGRFWGDLQFYRSYESIRAEGYTFIEDQLFKQVGSYVYDGYTYSMHTVIGLIDPGAPHIYLHGQESTPYDALPQFNSVFAELVTKWGVPTKIEISGEDEYMVTKDIATLVRYAHPFSYEVEWRIYQDVHVTRTDSKAYTYHETAYAASLTFDLDDRGVCRVSMEFSSN